MLHRSACVDKTAHVPTQKITAPDDVAMTGFVIVDLDGAEHADGLVRCAKKILMDGARTMARSRTYSWALVGELRSGASAGINTPPPSRAAGVAAFVTAVIENVRSGALSLDAAKGVEPAELSALSDLDGRSSLRNEITDHGTLADELTCRSAAIAAGVALGGTGGLTDRTVAIEGAGALEQVLHEVLAGMGATVVGADLGPEEVLRAEADVLLCGSKMGLVDHDVAGSLRVKVLAPIGVAPVTARGLAVAERAGVTVLADFLTLSGGLHSFVAGDGDTAESLRDRVGTRTAELTAAALAHDEGAYLGACALAEEFLATWQDQLPFGRPLA